MKRGDLVEARLLTIDDGDARIATATLEQPPAVEGAILAIDNRTGQMKAMVGGYSFERSKFNRATQALRQVGSAFKPIVYTAAIDRGYTPRHDPDGHAGELHRRRRVSRRTRRRTTTTSTRGRHAAPRARRIAQRAGGPADGPARATQVIAYARRLGLESPLPPYLSVALGAAEATLLEMTERLLASSRTRASA